MYRHADNGYFNRCVHSVSVMTTIQESNDGNDDAHILHRYDRSL